MVKRDDLDHKPENADKVGETHKELNQGSEEQLPVVVGVWTSGPFGTLLV